MLELAVPCVCGVIMAIYPVFLFWNCCRWKGGAAYSCRGFLQNAMDIFLPNRSDKLQARYLEEMERQELEWLRTAFPLGMHIGAFVGLLILLNAYNKKEFFSENIVFGSDLLAVSCVVLSGMLVHAFPRLRSRITVKCLHAALTLDLCSKVVAKPDLVVTHWYVSAMTFYRLLYIWGLSSTSRTSFILNTLYTVVFAGSALYNYRVIHVFSSLVHIGLSSCCMFGLTLLFHVNKLRMARSVVEAKSSTSIELSAGALLSQICDTVLYLDTNFKICRECTNFGSLLLNDTGNGMGRCFEEFIAEQDLPIFWMSMRDAAAVRTDQVNRQFYVSLKTAWGGHVKVQIYAVAYLDVVENQVQYIAGVCEIDQEKSAVYQQAPLKGARCKQTLVNSTSSSDVSVDNSLELFINCMTEKFDVLYCSSSFKGLIAGADDCVHLLPWVDPAQQSKFGKWVAINAHAIMNGVDPKPLVGLRLCPPHLLANKMTIKATVVLVEVAMNEAVTCAKLKFHDPKPARQCEASQIRDDSTRRANDTVHTSL